MKSKINTLADYRQAPFERQVVLHCPEEYVQTQLRHLTRAYKKTEPVTRVENGDVVVLAVESALPKFNRPMVPVTVGGKLYDEELEEQLPGHSVGETFQAQVQGETVTVTIRQASRTVFPEPTDEMAAAYAARHEGFAEIKTVAEYRRKVTEEYLEKERQSALFGAMDQVCSYVLTGSDWEFVQEEVDSVAETSWGEFLQSLEEDGKKLEDISSEQLQAEFGVSSIAELKELFQGGAEQQIATELWLEAVNGCSAEELENPFAFLEEYVRENLTMEEEE
jgi:FKBP-type peptidyl-prolyl cis-trans isomerase (trigger factor)